MNLESLRKELATLQPTRANPDAPQQVLSVFTKAVYALLRCSEARWLRLHVHDGRVGRHGELGDVPLEKGRSSSDHDVTAASGPDDLTFALRLYADRRGQEAGQSLIDFFVSTLRYARHGGKGTVEVILNGGIAGPPHLPAMKF